MANKFKDKKQKRKKGKKFVYRDSTQEVEKKKNPFEEISKKKSMKLDNKYNGLVNSYQSRHNVNSFTDRRLGEHSKNLSQDDKMKLRYKALQMTKIGKKDKFVIDDDDAYLQHNGRIIDDEHDQSDIDKSDDDYDRYDNYMAQAEKKTGKQILSEIISKNKMMKEERQNIKRANKEKIDILDDAFAELSTMLKKRQRTFGKAMDKYDKNVNIYTHTNYEKTHPTDRIKTENEIAMEKEMALLRKDEESEEEEKEEPVVKDKKLTKSERISKLLEERLKKAGVKEDSDKIVVKKKKGNENLSDLQEFEGEHDEDDGEDYEDDEEGGDYEDEDDFEEGDDYEDDEDGEDFEEDE
jgi:hypothetical protein